MNDRSATAVSAVIHVGFLALFSAVSWKALNQTEQQRGMEFEIVDKDYAQSVRDAVQEKSQDDIHNVPTSKPPASATQASAALRDVAERPETAEKQVQEAPQTERANSDPAAATAEDIAPPVKAETVETLPEIQPVPQLPDVPQLGIGPIAPPKVPQPTGELVPAVAPKAVAQSGGAPSASQGSSETLRSEIDGGRPNDAQAAAVRSQAASPRPMPGPARRQLNSQALAKLLEVQGASSTKRHLDSAAIGSAIGSAVPRGVGGLRLRERANLEEMIRSQITPCWNPPVPDEGAGAVSVLMRIRLDRGGAIAGFPTLTALHGEDSPYARAVVSSVRRAILQCSPLKLPPELYDAWSDVELNFDPKDVL